MIIKTQEVPKMFTVTLSEQQLAFAKKIGELRHRSSRSNDVHNNRQSAFSDVFVDANGACGEVAMLIMLLTEGHLNGKDFIDNLVDLRTMCVKSAAQGTDDGDIKLPSGLTIDVKTSNYANNNLSIPYKKFAATKIDTFAGMQGDYNAPVPAFKFIGWHKRESLKKMYRDTFGYGYCLYNTVELHHFASAAKLQLDQGRVKALLQDPRTWDIEEQHYSDEFKEEYADLSIGTVPQGTLRQMALFEGCDWWDEPRAAYDEWAERLDGEPQD